MHPSRLRRPAHDGMDNMALFENPFLLANQVRDLWRAISNWKHRLHSGDIDPSGPFVGKPLLTEREGFRQIRESNEPPALKQAWSRWAFRLTEARVNAPIVAALAQAYHLDLHRIERPEAMEITLQELLHRTLRRPAERSLWAGALADRAATCQSLSIELVLRRDEIARRAGYSDADELTLPAEELSRVATGLISATDDIYREVVPQSLAGWLDHAMALPADQGWPAQLTARSVQSILGGAGWTDGLEPLARTLPRPIAPASFVRALYHLGEAIAESAAPRHEPFVIAQDPYGLNRHTLGALCASLATSPRWHKDVLGLSRDGAREQSRALWISQLVHVRTTALAFLVQQRARQGATAVREQFDELSHQALGFVLPSGFAGFLPRLRSEIGQRLIGPCLASHWVGDLVSEFDEDWFRNPRGIEAVRERLARISNASVEPNELTERLDHYVSGQRAWS